MHLRGSIRGLHVGPFGNLEQQLHKTVLYSSIAKVPNRTTHVGHLEVANFVVGVLEDSGE